MKNKVITTTTIAALLLPFAARAGALGNISQASENSSETASRDASKSATDMSDASIQVSDTVYTGISKASDYVANLVVRGADDMSNASTVVFGEVSDKSAESKRWANKESRRLVTFSGRVIDGSVTDSQELLRASEKLADKIRDALAADSRSSAQFSKDESEISKRDGKATLDASRNDSKVDSKAVSDKTREITFDVITDSEDFSGQVSDASKASRKDIVGSVRCSRDEAEALLAALGRGYHAVIDRAGTLRIESEGSSRTSIQESKDDTSKIAMRIYDASKRAVKFIVDGSGKLLTFSKDEVMVVVNSKSAQSMIKASEDSSTSVKLSVHRLGHDLDHGLIWTFDISKTGLTDSKDSVVDSSRGSSAATTKVTRRFVKFMQHSYARIADRVAADAKLDGPAVQDQE